MLASLNNSHIVFRAIWCLTLYILELVSECLDDGLQRIVFLEEAHRKKRYCYYELKVALSWSLFCCSVLDYGTFKLRANMPTE